LTLLDCWEVWVALVALGVVVVVSQGWGVGLGWREAQVGREVVEVQEVEEEVLWVCQVVRAGLVVWWEVGVPVVGREGRERVGKAGGGFHHRERSSRPLGCSEQSPG
jgi:hypothetical protein